VGLENRVFRGTTSRARKESSSVALESVNELKTNREIGESELKIKNSCPFCGFRNAQVLGPSKSTHGKGFQVECINCGARGPCGMASSDDAILAWEKGDIPEVYERPLIPCRQDG
jgi:predicted RNA-binding Zn-ribbon protein involved in translation (DUF1610 family)